MRRPSGTRGDTARPNVASSWRLVARSSSGTLRTVVTITRSPAGVMPWPGWMTSVWPPVEPPRLTCRPDTTPVPVARARSSWRWRT